MLGSRSRTAIALAGVAGLTVLAAWPGAARSATNDDEDPTGVRPPPRGIDQEIIGVELPLMSGILKQAPGSFTEGQSRVEAGGGLAIRVGRHRWDHAYYTPIAVGLFLASDTGYVHALTEGGVIVPGTGRRLELGAAIGMGILRMTYSTHCDGDCNVGGVGAMVSPVVRWLFISRRDLTVGASARAVIPLSGQHGRGWFGDFSGFGSILLAGLEVGFGRR